MTRRHGAPARRTWVIWVAVLVIAIAVPFGSFDPFSLFGPQVVRSQGNFQFSCRVIIGFWNQKRRVPGPVNEECDDVQYPTQWHDPPFGNWGVDSNYGARWNGDQFAGWKNKGNQLHEKTQWNSCTTERPQVFPMGNSAYFNDPIPARTKQKADPDDARAYAVQQWDTGYPFDPDMSCEDVLPPLLVYSGLFMNLYELDAPDNDDWVASMSYPTHSVPITCQSAWNCTGASVEGWTPPSSSSQATADIRLTLETYRLQ